MFASRWALCALWLISSALGIWPSEGSSFYVLAQPKPTGFCGSSLTPAQAQAAYQRHLSLLRLNRGRSTTHYRIPVQMHIIRHNDGTGGFDPAEMPLVITSANVLFSQVNVEIYEYKSVDFINSDFFFYDCTNDAQWDSLKRSSVEPEAINIYWVPDESGFPYCGISAFPGSGTQGIIMNNLCGGLAQPFNSTIVHEIGHYFDLYHTHETAFGSECPNGSNCSVAGDLLCDTPADPDLYQHVSPAPDCIYDNYAAPPGGCDATPYNPQVNNMMSYSYKACLDLFTPQQIDKFRLVLETTRLELDVIAGSLAYRPRQISPLLAVPGTIADTTIRVTNIGANSTTIYSVTAMAGRLDISGTAPVTLPAGTYQDYVVSYDASGASGACDVGQILDEIRFITDDTELPEKYIPVAINVVYSQPSVSSNSFGSNCLTFTVPNTPGFGNQALQALYNDLLGNVVFDASLLVGTVDGTDTVVYQDNYNQADFAVVDGFADSSDALGRTLQKLRFATNDGRIYGDVTYYYGWNSQGVDSCAQVVAIYKLRNICDTALTVAVGVFADFDVDDYTVNNGVADATPNAIEVASTLDENRVVALASLASSALTPRMRVISNASLIYPTSSLPDRTAYRELVAGNSGNEFAVDVSALLSFGKLSLPTDGEITIPVAFLLSSNGDTPFAGLISTLKSMLSGGSASCGDADANGIVNISDAVYLINYIFAGGPAPIPLDMGDVDCNGHVTISDIVYMVNYIFKGGPAPCQFCP